MVAKLTPPRSRKTYLDCLNILAILAVLFLHHNGIVHSFSNSRLWATSLIPETVFYFAVPLFCMITGSTLLAYKQKYDTKTFFKKRFTKILIPAAAWISIMLIWRVFILHEMTIQDWSPINLANIIFSNQENGIYYYLFVILGIYLTIPLLSPLSEKKNRNLLKYGILAFFVFNALIPNLLLAIGVAYNGDFSLQVGGYIVYVLLGYYLSTTDIPKKYRIMLYIGALLAIIWRYTTTLNESIAHNELAHTTWGYWQFHTIILTSAVYVFVKNLSLNKISEHTKAILAKLAGCSFGIYLCHIIVMHYESSIFRRIGLSDISWVYRFICPFLTYALCVLLVLLLKKIPFLRRIVP